MSGGETPFFFCGPNRRLRQRVRDARGTPAVAPSAAADPVVSRSPNQIRADGCGVLFREEIGEAGHPSLAQCAAPDDRIERLDGALGRQPQVHDHSGAHGQKPVTGDAHVVIEILPAVLRGAEVGASGRCHETARCLPNVGNRFGTVESKDEEATRVLVAAGRRDTSVEAEGPDATPTGQDGDELLVPDAVRHWRRDDADVDLALPDRLAGVGGVGHEATIRCALEHQIARGGQDASIERPRVFDAPDLLLGYRIPGLEIASRWWLLDLGEQPW